ncbi:hypothetical protein EVAR_83395_1 [Eumeta japonica]|uniref:Uncharacterized protein n=1 Tax=Eumeta variegata TaxID=151549 RepID=A0A4C1TYE7_EUMVA|nr:hypothetical protein EVAR_83395_1 [Eumeta japonica]
MRSLRSMCGVSCKDSCRNNDVRKRCGLKEDVVTRVERDMLQWFGHLEWINESRLTKQMYRANVCDGKQILRHKLPHTSLLLICKLAKTQSHTRLVAADNDRPIPHRESNAHLPHPHNTGGYIARVHRGERARDKFRGVAVRVFPAARINGPIVTRAAPGASRGRGGFSL